MFRACFRDVVHLSVALSRMAVLNGHARGHCCAFANSFEVHNVDTKGAALSIHVMQLHKTRSGTLALVISLLHRLRRLIDRLNLGDSSDSPLINLTKPPTHIPHHTDTGMPAIRRSKRVAERFNPIEVPHTEESAISTLATINSPTSRPNGETSRRRSPRSASPPGDLPAKGPSRRRRDCCYKRRCIYSCGHSTTYQVRQCDDTPCRWPRYIFIIRYPAPEKCSGCTWTEADAAVKDESQERTPEPSEGSFQMGKLKKALPRATPQTQDATMLTMTIRPRPTGDVDKMQE